ncbi:MAG: hypothetical protein JSS66_03725 [Armatimonadetes bacterium]|nr:hypothetical protein [Armatimonadota bacterium]
MPRLSWVRFARRMSGLVKQPELPNIESLIDRESDQQPSRNYFVLSCAIPAGIATFGFGSVFVAWLAGNTGLPLVLGSVLTAVLAGAAWYLFFRLYKSVSESRRRLRDAVLKFAPRYAGFGNVVAGEHVLTEEYAALLDEAAGLYLRHAGTVAEPATTKALRAIEEAMGKLMEVAASKDRQAQVQALDWANPVLDELRLLSRSLDEHARASKVMEQDDPVAGLRQVRAELDGTSEALQELHDHVQNS